jgi:two-component system NarL family response regulator
LPDQRRDTSARESLGTRNKERPMNPWPSRPLNVIVTHAQPLLAAGLVASLRSQPDLDVLAHDAASGDETGGARTDDADVVVTDYTQGIRLATQARRPGGARPAPRVLVVTSHDREHEVRLALESGVHGYLLLGSPVEELTAGVRMLGQGRRYLGMEVSQRMADSLTRESLTGRETEVLRLLSRGLCNKSIASELVIGVGTVKAHVRGIMGKLDASSRTQVVSIAARRGLAEEPCPQD